MTDDAGDVRRGATSATRATNDALAASLPFEDRRDFEQAARGFIAPLPEGGVIRN
jgi:alkyl sulfatase BDS1-like metallo-beta-lactamase superfamily hydrolase